MNLNQLKKKTRKSLQKAQLHYIKFQEITEKEIQVNYLQRKMILSELLKNQSVDGTMLSLFSIIIFQEGSKRFEVAKWFI